MSVCLSAALTIEFHLQDVCCYAKSSSIDIDSQATTVMHAVMYATHRGQGQGSAANS